MNKFSQDIMNYALSQTQFGLHELYAYLDREGNTDISHKTVSWYLTKLIESGKLQRVAHGKYAIGTKQQFLIIPTDEQLSLNEELNITHYNYWKDQENNFDVQPYCVKLFRQRWYLIGLSTYTYFREQGSRIYSLDRLRHVHVKEETFDMPKDWDAKEYFAGCYGIIAGLNKQIKDIKLKVSAGQAN